MVALAVIAVVAALFAAAALPATAAAGTTERVSVDGAGNQANTGGGGPSISADGRFVAFESYADNLVPGDTNNLQDVFVRNVEPTPNDNDGDGVADATDNCPNVANQDQADADSDGVGDACEQPMPQISIADTSVNEGDSDTSQATFNVTLSEASTNAVTVDYATADGMATQPDDYEQEEGAVTFEANQTTATVTVPVRGDTADEPDESFSVILSNPQHADIADGEGSGTIVDDDEAAPTDSDGDGVADATDNCPEVSNQDQAGANGDGVGDLCEPVSYTFSGFFQPVDNLPTFNKTKPGKNIPIRFSLDGDKGLDIFEPGYPKSEPMACDSNAVVDGIEQTTTGKGGLSYDAVSDRYTYNWTTSSTASGCQQFVMKLKDGSVQRANFIFK
jgi:hypothetical protein